MKKLVFGIITVLAVFGSANLFAYDLGNGLSVTEPFPGTFLVEDNINYRCYSVSIKEDRWGYYELSISLTSSLLGDYFDELFNKVAKDGATKAIERGLISVGMKRAYAAITSSVIFDLFFNSSPAY